MSTWIVKRMGTNKNIGTVNGEDHDKITDTAVRLFGKGIYLVLKEVPKMNSSTNNPNTFYPDTINNHYVCKHYDNRPNAFIPNMVRPFPEEDELNGGTIQYDF